MEPRSLAVDARVVAEAERFRDELPQLMQKYAGRWIVFHEGQVVSSHATEEEAFVAGLSSPGPDAGHVVAAVREIEDVFVGAPTDL